MGSLGSIARMAFERELEYLNEKLRENPSILLLFSSMFKDDTLTALLKNVATSSEADADDSAKTQGAPRRLLRKGLKKFKHLKQRCAPFVAEALQTLEPTLFPENKVQLGQYELLKVALCVEDASDFIVNYYRECQDVERCLAAFKLRYETMGKTLSNFTKDEIDNKRAGYYKVTGAKKIISVFSPQVVYDIGFGTEVAVVSPTDLKSDAAVTMDGGKKCKVELAPHFSDLSVVFPDLSEHWELKGFEKVELQDYVVATLLEPVALTSVIWVTAY